VLKFLIYLRALFPDHSILWMTLDLPCSSSSSIIYRVALGRPRRERMVMVVDDFVCYTTFDVVDFNSIWMQEHNILLQRNKIPYRSNTGQRTGAYRTPPDCSCCAYRRSACTHAYWFGIFILLHVRNCLRSAWTPSRKASDSINCSTRSPWTKI